MRLLLLLLFFAPLVRAEKSITVFVALCDNATQGIAPVGAKIGNGDDAASNLYWGCSDGMKLYFKRSAKWTLTKSEKPEATHILETCHFTHKGTDTKLTAHAYRGSRMAKCLEDFFLASRNADSDKLVAFIGHNGLMDTTPKLPAPVAKKDKASSTIVLCCLSQSWFEQKLASYQAHPVLLTRQLMYPGSFILHDCIEVWLKGGTRPQHREAAAKAYARNQKISVKAARGIFADLKGP